MNLYTVKLYLDGSEDTTYYSVAPSYAGAIFALEKTLDAEKYDAIDIALTEEAVAIAK